MALIDNCVAYWKFDEASGDAADSIGALTLTNVNSTAYASGKIGNGADLEAGSSQYFWRNSDDAALDFTDAFSSSFWVRFESLPTNNHNFFHRRTPAGNQRAYHFFLEQDATPRLVFQWWSDGLNANGDVGVSWSPSTATWYHVAITKSGTSVKFYINGSQQGATQTGTGAAVYNSTSPFYVGAFVGDSQYIDGIMDEMGFWSRQLSDAEVSSLYNGGNGDNSWVPGTSTFLPKVMIF